MPQGNMMRNYKLLKKALLVVAATGLIGLILCAVYIQKDTSLDSLQRVSARTTSSELDEQVKIGVIGDSWVAGGIGPGIRAIAQGAGCVCPIRHDGGRCDPEGGRSD